MAFYRSLSVYLPGGPETKARAGAGVRAQETAEIRTGVSLLLVKAPPALRRVQGPAI